MKYLLLHNIRSLQNVGSLFRSADGAWWDRVYLTWYTGTPPRKEISKTALGAEDSLSWEYYEDPLVLLSELIEQGTIIYSLELTPQSEDIFEFFHSTFSRDLTNNARREIWKWQFERDICLILGSERDWVDPTLLAYSERVFHIPMHGIKASLNVSVAGAIGMYMIWGNSR